MQRGIKRERWPRPSACHLNSPLMNSPLISIRGRLELTTPAFLFPISALKKTEADKQS